MNKSNEQIKKLAKCISEIPNGTLQEIADKAGISKATLYRNYGSREGLVEAIKQRALDVLEDIYHVTCRQYEDLSECMTALIQAHMDEFELFSYLSSFQETWDWECWVKYNQSIDSMFLKWQEKGIVKLKFSAEFLTEMFVSSLCGLCDGMIQGRIASKKMNEVFLEFFLHGIKN